MRAKKQRKSYIYGLATGILLSFFLFKLLPDLNSTLALSKISNPFAPQPTPTPDPQKVISDINKVVLPNKVNLKVSFKDTIVKLVENGAIDKDKFISLYKDRGGLSTDEKNLLENPSDSEIVITEKNAQLLLNLLWPLGIANKSTLLSEGPMGTKYKDTVGNFASTGGWTLGKIDGGSLFTSLNILALTSTQEKTVQEIAENIYRPCCGNSTYFPDCNHGAAMLGFIELAVSQGLPKDEIYKKALALNSYWFPQTYTELGVYFKMKKNISWTDVNAKDVLGSLYSSGQGYQAIDKELQAEGLIPKVSGGGGCGV